MNTDLERANCQRLHNAVNRGLFWLWNTSALVYGRDRTLLRGVMKRVRPKRVGYELGTSWVRESVARLRQVGVLAVASEVGYGSVTRKRTLVTPRVQYRQ